MGLHITPGSCGRGGRGQGAAIIPQRERLADDVVWSHLCCVGTSLKDRTRAEQGLPWTREQSRGGSGWRGQRVKGALPLSPALRMTRGAEEVWGSQGRGPCEGGAFAQ